MNETPKERTERMLKEQRRLVVEHDKASRANEGKYQFPLRQKLYAALPLVAIVASLYTFSFYFSRIRKAQYLERQANKEILKDVRDIDAPDLPDGLEKVNQGPEFLQYEPDKSL